MQKERKLAALREALGDEGWTKGEEGVFFCPKHEHAKRKLSVNLKTDAFHCWVCGWGHKNSIEPILKLKRDSQYYAEYTSEKRPQGELSAKIYDKVCLPKEYRSLSVGHRSPWFNQAMGYLAKRGLGPSDVIRYKLGYCEDGEYRNRIIIPSFDEYGELNFVVGRTFYENDMKYKHGHYDKDIIFNEYLIDWKKPVTLVEGPFDAMKAGFNAIPLQTNALRTGSKLFKKIVENDVKVFIALDADAFENVLKISDTLIGAGVDVNVITWPANQYKDPGDMPKGKLEEFRDKAIRMSSKFDTVKLKVAHSASMRNQ